MRLEAVALIVAVVALAACGGPESTAPTTTTTATTSTTKATTTSVATTTTEPLAPLPEDPELRFHLLTDFDEPVLLEEVREAMVTARQMMGDTSPLDVYVYRDAEGAVDQYMAITGASPRTRALQDLEGNTAMASRVNGVSFAFISNRTFLPFYSRSHFTITAHEAAHAAQAALFGRNDNVPSNRVLGRGPIWLVEGHADSVGYRAAHLRRQLPDQSEDLDSIREVVVERALTLDVPLSELSTWDQMAVVETDPSYGKGALAAEWLIHRSGEDAVDRQYWQRAGQIGWESAFGEVFGLSVGDFYVQFDAWAAAGYPPLDA